MTDLSTATAMPGESARLAFGNGVRMPDLPNARSEPESQYYELNTTEGAIRLSNRTVATGVTLDESGISWVLTNGQARRRAYREITEVHLDIDERPDYATCRITFSNGPRLQLVSFYTHERYGQFITDLHRRLHAHGTSTIKFHGGSPRFPTLVRGSVVVLVVIAVLLVVGSLAIGQASLAATVAIPLFLLITAMAIWRGRAVTYTADNVPPQFYP